MQVCFVDIKILQQALGKVRLIEESSAQHFAEILFHILNSNKVDIKAGLFDETEAPYRSNSKGVKTASGEVFVLPVYGIMMRNDFCGAMGTDSIAKMLQVVYRDSSFSSIVLKMNTPGDLSKELKI